MYKVELFTRIPAPTHAPQTVLSEESGGTRLAVCSTARASPSVALVASASASPTEPPAMAAAVTASSAFVEKACRREGGEGNK